MQFSHAPDVRSRFPELRARALVVAGIDALPDAGPFLAPLAATADARLAADSEGQFPEIQAWRRAFALMGLKPTQVRCASEALLRRYRKDGALPRLHPLIDLCNAVSLAYAIPVAVFDTARIDGALTVRPAEGSETYQTFAGETEHPEPGEIIFADDAGRAHARRWCNRQSGWSAVGQGTSDALIVAEALHPTAEADLAALVAATTAALAGLWPQVAIAEVVLP
jgi:DNA/RNA-binding domain of Phe-tRNA-synthetase-like protein